MGQIPNRRRVHSIPRLIIVNWLSGMVAGAVCASIVLALDLVGIRTLIREASEPWIALILLYGGFIFTFGGLVAATAVMTLKADDD